MEETMKSWSSADEVLDFAIGTEEESAKFYEELASRATSESMRSLFAGFATEEKGHKAKLERIKAGGQLKPSEAKILDLKIGDYLVDVEPSGGELDYQAALILAMKREKAAFRLYSDLARTAHDGGLRDVLLALAQEEAKHKLRFEIEYDDQIYKEN
jgi:rubrerythrin